VLDLHFVTPGLAVGSCFTAEAAAELAREHGISRVVDVRLEACDDEAVLRTHGITLLHLPTEDTRAISQARLRDGVAFAAEGLRRRERVFVHCQWGIGRSALLALCVLVDAGEAPLAALERLKAARPVVSPSPEQLEALLRFAARVKTEREAPWPLPTVEALGAVAWRHLAEGAGVDRASATAASTRS
jgi:protein-tyrosine phosphatase